MSEGKRDACSVEPFAKEREVGRVARRAMRSAPSDRATCTRARRRARSAIIAGVTAARDSKSRCSSRSSLFAERRRAPDQRHARVGEALQQMDEVHEAVEIVLEPQHDLAVRRARRRALLLFEQIRAHAQQILAVRLGERTRARLDPLRRPGTTGPVTSDSRNASARPGCRCARASAATTSPLWM